MTDPVAYPKYWLLFGLPWPDGESELAESAIVIAPPIIPRRMLGPDALDILSVADAYVEASRSTVVFFSDLTLWLDDYGSSWASRGVDWETGQEQILDSPTPALFLSLTYFAHLVVCDASRQGLTLHYPDHSEQITPEQREDARNMITNNVTADWPGYINSLVSSGKLRHRENS